MYFVVIVVPGLHSAWSCYSEHLLSLFLSSALAAESLVKQ
jgi:hypothetical protein